MHLGRKIGVCLAAATLAAGFAPTASADPGRDATTEGSRKAARDHARQAVTLLTGDRVEVSDAGPTIRPGKGRDGIRFVTHQIGGHLHVVPTDALDLVDAGRLDGRLFDVTTLIEYGYTDAQRADLPLIVTGDDTARQHATAAGGTVTRQLPSIGGVALNAARDGAFWQGLTGGARGLGTAAAGKVWLDGVRKPTLDVSVPQIGAPAAWQAGYTGAGVTVAVLDTGIDATHPDLAGRITAAQNFTPDADTKDTVGHGTHVASTIVGGGQASGGKYKGVAPDAKLLVGKVCALQSGCSESGILAGMEWAATQGAKVANMSLGGPDSPEVDPLEQAVETLTAKYGTLFVIAAGNSGEFDPVSSPASADSALAVGAVDSSDALAPFSSRGPRIGDAALKPDVTAPGVAITAAFSSDAGGDPDHRYVAASGTSMATPHTAGAAAILAQRHPDWKPADLKAGLMATAKPNPSLGVYAQGAGRIDVAKAIGQTLLASPASVSLGQQRWPHTDDTPMTRNVTLHNTGTAPVALALTVAGAGPDGKPAPAGMFTISPATVEAPAGGEARVTVTANTRVASPDGFFGGALEGRTAGTLAVRVPLAVDKEVESYDLTLTHTDRAGNVPARYYSLVMGIDSDRFKFAFDPDGSATVRLPKGRYNVSSLIQTPPATPGTPLELALLAQPVLTLDRDTATAFDARTAKPLSVTLDRPSARTVLATAGFSLRRPDGHGTGHTVVSRSLDGLFTGQVGPDRPLDGFTGEVDTQWAEPGNDGKFQDSPYFYHLAYYERGRMFTGLSRHARDQQLAVVKATHRASVEGRQAVKVSFAREPGGSGGWGSGLAYSKLPFSRTEYYNTADGGEFSGFLLAGRPRPGSPFPETVAELDADWTRYRAGRTTEETWGKAVFGPAFGPRPAPVTWVTRTGDDMFVYAPMFGDADGRAGFSFTDRARTTLLRDGQKVGETSNPGSGMFAVPAQAGTYRLEVEAERGSAFPLSTRVSTAWTFRSAHTGTARPPVPLPVAALRFAPHLDDQQSTPGGRVGVVPLTVQWQPGATHGRLRELTVEASVDDGATWRRVPVLPCEGGYSVLLVHPRAGGYVSLRGTARDGDGNAVEQTIIRAYRVAAAA